ncbi:PilZ domain-containing protein [Aliikangiella sp. IMCC44359]|uniref:PilZ domain-containing protein n=1 Tax=Aliikangiella sp. IMCC44359 TaxID=3459125 RepID=UPI00403AB714
MSSLNKDHEEKRNFIRMFVDAKVTVTDPETGQTFQGDSRNLSGDGVMFITEQEFKTGQILDVDIRSEQSKLAPLQAKFEVKRTRKLENGHFEIAGTIDSVK